MAALPLASTWVKDSRNLLHMAATVGSLTHMKDILAREPISVNQVDPDGWTPAMIAAERGFTHVVRFLMDQGADVSMQACDGSTALMRSAQNGHRAVVQALLTANANVRAANIQGFTALHVAAADGHSRIVKLLLEAGADCDSRMPNGVTPLYFASMDGHLGAVRELLRAKADPHLARALSSWERGIPLDVAAQFGHTEVVREFLKLGIRACGGESRGVEALRLAARFKHMEIMIMLTDAGVVDAGPALTCAASFGSVAELMFLFRQQEPTPDYLDARDHGNRTPAYCCVRFCYPNAPRVLRLLINVGSDVTSPVEVFDDSMWRVVSRYTPLDLANLNLREKKVNGEDATEEQLQRLGALRRLLLQLDAVHAVSWLWPSGARITAVGAESAGKVKKPPTQLMPTLPMLRRMASKRSVSMAAVFRYTGKT